MIFCVFAEFDLYYERDVCESLILPPLETSAKKITGKLQIIKANFFKSKGHNSAENCLIVPQGHLLSMIEIYIYIYISRLFLYMSKGVKGIRCPCVV